MANCSYHYEGQNYTKQELVDLIRDGKVADEQRSEIKYTIYETDPIRILLNIEPKASLENHLEMYYSDMLDKVKSYNSGVTFSFDEGITSEFNPATNNVNISLSEVYNTANKYDVDYKEVLNQFIEHEVSHAVTLAGSKDPAINAYITSAIAKAKQLYDTKPFEDTIRAGTLYGGYPYAFLNVEEFLSEHQSNPDFKKWMKSIGSQVDRTYNFWEKIQNYIRNLIGLDPINSFYTDIQELIDSESYREVGIELMTYYPEEFMDHTALKFNKIWFNTSELLKSEYETNPDLKKIFEDLPKKISTIKEKLKKVDPKSKDAKNLNSIIQRLYAVSEAEDKVKALIDFMQSAYLISENLVTDMRGVLKATDDLDKQIHLMYILNQQANSLEVLRPMITQLSSILTDRSIADDNTGRFNSQISRILTAKDLILSEYIKLAKTSTARRFSIENVNTEVADQIKALIDLYKSDLAKATSIPMINLLNKRIMDAENRLKQVPTENILNAVLNGEIADASMIDLNLQSLALNGHPLIQTAAKKLTDADNLLAARRVEKENVMQTILSKLKAATGLSSLRDMKNDITKKITVEVTRIKSISEDANGNMVENAVKQLMFITDYNPEFITDFDRINAEIEFLEGKRSKLKSTPDKKASDEEKRKLNEKISEAYDKRYKFQREHTEGYYKDSYYAHKNILNEKLTGLDTDGNQVTVSLNDRYGELFDEIAQSERAKRQTADSDTLIEIAETLDGLWSEYSEVSNRYTNLGVEKEGIDKLLYEQAVKYRTARNKIGNRILTDSDKVAFENLKLSFLETRDYKLRGLEREETLLDKQLNADEISANAHAKFVSELNKKRNTIELDYQKSLSSIVQTSPTQEYFDEKDEMRIIVEGLRQQILQIPEMMTLLGGEEEAKKLSKQNYTKLAELAKAYRDNDGSIDGIAYTKNKPESVAIVKEIQEAEVALAEKMRKITGLSYAENNEYFRLKIIKGLRSDLDQARFDELTALKKSIQKVSEDNKKLFEDYSTALSIYMEMSKSSNTAYYEREVERQKSNMVKKLENEALANFEDWLVDNNLTENVDKSYSVYETKPDGTVLQIKKYSDQLSAINQISQEKTKNEFVKSPWYIANHFERNEYIKNKVGSRGTFQKVMKPIYIWVEQKPVDPKYIGEPEPLFSFKTFIINEDQLNPNYKMVSQGLTQPKKSSKYYKPEALTELQQNKPLYDLHQSLRAFYYKSQEDSEMLDSERLFDILPAVPKHHQENKINLVDGLKENGLKQSVKNFWDSKLGVVDEDSQVIQGGSISSTFKNNKIIPFRFNGLMDVSQQSFDPFTSLLIYDNINSDVNNKKALEEMFQTALASTDDLERTTETTLAGGFTISNIMALFKNKSKNTKIIEIKEGKSVLNQTLQHMLDTYIYGETKADATFNVLGGKVDGHKAVASLKKLSATMIFGLKWFGPVKNYLSSTINGFINTGLGEGFASKEDYALAVAKAPLMMRHLIQDYRKIGNKSKFGQAMDFFKVLQGGVTRADTGKFVQWTALGEFTIDNLSIIKNSTELAGQVTTFLSISYANKVEINGVEVPFYEAFEIKDNKFQPKANAKINGNPLSQNDINHFIGKISYINRRINGAFRDLEKSKAEKGALGSMAFYLNGFVMPGLKARFGSEQYISEGNFTTKGYYAEGMSFLREGLKAGISFKEVKSTLTKEQLRRVHMFKQELLTAAFFSIAVALMSLGGGDTKKKLKGNSAIYNYLFALMMGVGSEIQTFIPFPGLGADEALRKASNPFAAVRQLVIFGKMFGHLGSTIFGGGRFEKQGVEDGLHDPGDLKIIADLVSLFGWNMKEWDSVEKAMQVKLSQQLR